ncbi:MAG: DUF58 domain-containing protein [Planctomycetes bacterium]|nr:DUF58 domain-containing protein [Planctomycetota bacterium]MCC7397546.1 DUF58 domain-containing protein [Planctomycetota bacterium]
MSAIPTNYLDPHVLDKVARLELRARLVVEGFVTGMHKSPYRGFSVEFAQHREYVPGDDLRHLDWKIFAKADRFVVKQYEEETNLRAHLFLDQSESMNYAHDGGMSKFDYAATGCASLAYLIQQQADAVGLTLFDDKIVKQVPPSNTRANLGNLFQALEQAKARQQKTKIGAILHDLSAQFRQRGLVLIFSDLFDAPEEVLKGLREIQSRGHDVVVFHVLDKDEVEFPFERMTLFQGLEQMPELLCDPKSLRDAYLAEIEGFAETMRKGCLGQRIDYVRVVNHMPLDVVLTSYLSARAARAKRRK